MEHIPSDKNPFPEMDLGLMDEILDVAKAAGKRAIDLVRYRPPSAPNYMSNHYRGESRIATPEEFKQLELPDGIDISNRWDSLGNYISSEDF